ncbi:MAG: protein of unknown function DUF115 [uncultured bacterium]|nr:MAG: protein of unknown function DUF115 [uncultured bacterium]
MGESFLEKNLAQISRYDKDLADKIAKHDQLEGEIEFLESKCGDIILSYNGILLHDDIDPQEEALEVFQKISSNKKSTIHVLFGLGLGYLFKRFCMSCKGRIIVYEPNLDILKITLEAVDLSEDLSKENIIIVNSTECIQKAFNKFYFGEASVNLSFLKSYAKLYPGQVQELAQELGFVKSLYFNNYNNLFNKCYFWTIWGIRHIPKTVNNYDLESLRGKFKGKPAVIISAGPSLTKNIGLLKEYKDKVVTFCVGTALKTAVNHQIQPDFLTVVEAEDCSFQAKEINVSDMNLILHPMTHDFFQDLPTKRRFNYYPNNDFTAKWLANHFDIPIQDYKNKGTVSMCALFSAMIMGCNPIIVIGQDLAYTDGKCYSNGSPLHNLECSKNEKTGKYEIQTPDDTELLKILDPEGKSKPEDIIKSAKSRFDEITENLYQVKGQNEEMLWTDPGYAMFIRYFENTASEFKKQIQFINSTEGGAYIEGFEHIPLKTVLEKYTKNHLNIETIIQESVKTGSPDKKSKIILKEVDKTIKLLKESFSYFEEGKKATEKLLNHFDLNEIHTESFKNTFSEILTNFLIIENRILNQNTLIFGLAYPQYSQLQNYLITSDDNIDEESMQTFIDLATNFFINLYSRIQNSDLPDFQAIRDRLYESCNSTSQKSIC